MLEAGVDIEIQLPGKRTQSINLLSGGEKSLSAVALIFSILLHKPTPFLILDEVDAALDDANIALFNQFVKDISERSQIILVTHNKKTMEVSDNLFGVSMEKKGISTLVSRQPEPDRCLKQVKGPVIRVPGGREEKCHAGPDPASMDYPDSRRILCLAPYSLLLCNAAGIHPPLERGEGDFLFSGWTKNPVLFYTSKDRCRSFQRREGNHVRKR